MEWPHINSCRLGAMETEGESGGEGEGGRRGNGERGNGEVQGGVRWEEKTMECTKNVGKWCGPFISTSTG